MPGHFTHSPAPFAPDSLDLQGRSDQGSRSKTKQNTTTDGAKQNRKAQDRYSSRTQASSDSLELSRLTDYLVLEANGQGRPRQGPAARRSTSSNRPGRASSSQLWGALIIPCAHPTNPEARAGPVLGAVVCCLLLRPSLLHYGHSFSTRRTLRPSAQQGSSVFGATTGE